jgi:hypothetical protein
MFRYALLFVSLPLLAAGGEGLFYAANSRRQTAMTCEDFIRQRPRVAWVRLTNCEIDYLGAGFTETRKGDVAQLFFPVRPRGQSRETPAVLIATTRDGEALSVAQQTIGHGRQPDQEQLLVMMLTIVTKLQASREVEGYARRTLAERLALRRVVSGLGGPIAPDFIAIDLHGRSTILLPAAVAGSGAAALLAFIVLSMRTRAQPAVEDEETVSVASQPHTPPMPVPRLRGLMLLNVPPDAGPDAVEFAAPLGPRQDVIATLAGLMPGLRPDARGRCVYVRPDHSMAIELGAMDPVVTAVLEAEGDGAIGALRALLARTGWRVFAPKLGRFVDADRLADLDVSVR